MALTSCTHIMIMEFSKPFFFQNQECRDASQKIIGLRLMFTIQSRVLDMFDFKQKYKSIVLSSFISEPKSSKYLYLVNLKTFSIKQTQILSGSVSVLTGYKAKSL